MTDKILVVTPPDDILLDGIRITHIELTEDQSQLISSTLMQVDLPQVIINYVWRTGDRVEWLLDKVSKSHIVFFNADADTGIDTILGWVAAQPHSHYFGNLKDLHLANNRAIYNIDNIVSLLEKTAKRT